MIERETRIGVLLHRRATVLGWITAVPLAADFGGAVVDRFGALGAPGESGGTWGDWKTFTAYTGELVPWLPDGLVGAAAVGAAIPARGRIPGKRGHVPGVR